MVKKFFGLLGVTAVTGIVVASAVSGCAGNTTFYIVDEGGTEGGKTVISGEGGPPKTTDAGKKETSVSPPDQDADINPPPPSGTCPSTTPITAADIDAALPWKPPAPFQNVCSQTNIDALKTAVTNAPATGISYAAIKTALGTACSACAFSNINAATWQVFVEDAGGAIDNRSGACFAIRSNSTCGQARVRWEGCLDTACPIDTCGTSQAAYTACVTAAQSGACNSLTSAYATACPNEATLAPICSNMYGAIATVCSGGPSNTINPN